MPIQKDSRDRLVGFSIGSGITFISLIARSKDMYLISPGLSREKIKNEQIEYWISRRGEYSTLITEIKDLEEKRKSLQMI